MLFQFNQLVVAPGQQILLQDVSWQTFETLLEELAESRAARLSYSKGMLEVMVPLPEHEYNKNIIGDLVKILLEEQQTDFIALGSTTFKNANMIRGVEPDECFYIQHEALLRGKSRIDLTVDPPPDLAIEIDLTARTHFDNYEVLGVPELWRYSWNHLEILRLQDGHYQAAERSQYFPDFPLTEVIPRYLADSKIQGRNAAIWAFRRWVRECLEAN